MGTITDYGSKHSHEFKLTVNETSTSVANNTSEISFSFTIYKASYSWSNWKSITYSISINGTSYSGTISSYSAGSTLTIRTGSQTVGHNSDGTKTINYSFSVNDSSGQSYTCGNASASGTLELTKIARNPSFTTKPRVTSKGLNWIKFKYGATDIYSDIYYSLDNSNWIHVTSDETTISNLTPETQYTIYVQARNQADNSLRTTTTISGTTYAIAKITTASNVNIGSSHTITWSNPSGASTSLKLCKTDGTTVIDYSTVTGTSKTITPTASTIYALTPNSNTITLRYIITTTENSKNYTNYKDCIFTVTNSNPTFSDFTYQDTNTNIIALTGNNQILVNGYSNVKVTISTANKATAKNSATMKRYKLLDTTANYNASADVNMSINRVNNNVIDVYAIDSRGNSTKVSKTATIKNYSNIKIKSLSVARQNNVGTTTTLNFEGEFWNASFGSVTNAITSCKYKYKTTSSSSWIDGKTTLTYTISGNKITGSLNIQGDAGTDGFSTNNSFDIQLILSDKLSTETYNVILSSGNPALAIYKNNVAIGQKYDTSEDSKLQVNGKINATGLGTNLAKVIVDKIYPVGSIYMSVNSTSPQTLFGGTWERMKGGFLYGCVENAGNSSITGTSTGASSGSTGGPSTNTSGSTTLTVDQIPSHNHNSSDTTYWMLGTEKGNQATAYVDYNANTSRLWKWRSSVAPQGGGKGHTHTLSNHTHSLNSHTHEIPYMAVFVWKRTK